ncbi:MAG: carboxyl transferase domain-containing protein [Verrucomicrobiaceae bacterium]
MKKVPSRPENAGMLQLVEQLAVTRKKVLDEGRLEAVAKQHKKGQLTARERIAYLCDEQSFIEYGAFVEPIRNTRHNADLVAPADGMVTGSGLIDGRPVTVAASDYTVMGGSVGINGRHKIVKAAKRAAEAGMPFIMLHDGGGHRVQDGLDARHFASGNQIWDILAKMSGWVPVVSAIMGPGFAAASVYSSLADFVVMIRGKSAMGMAGPALVRAGTGEEIDKEALGGAATQVDRQGVAHLAVDNDQSCLDAIKGYLAYLPSNASCEPPKRDDPGTDAAAQEVLLDIVPTNLRRAYDVRRVVKTIADPESVFEIQPTYARSIVVAFARMGGRPVGILANQPMVSAGIIDAGGSDKASHFIALCDAFGLPLIFLIDVPGFIIGSVAEATGLARRSGRMIFELGCATVPRFSVVMRKGYGMGFCAMAGGQPSFNVDGAIAWPTAEISAMSVEGAVDVAYRKEYEAHADPKKRRQEIIDEFRQQLSPLRSAEHFHMDDVVDPRDTRSYLIDMISRSPIRRQLQQFPRKRSISPI